MIPHLVTLSNEFINLSLKYKNIRLAKTRISNITKNYDASVVGNRLDDNNNQIANFLIHFLVELLRYLQFQNYNKQGLLLTQMHVYKKIDN